MNLASWLLLAFIIAICTYIIYKRFVNKSGDCSCGDCSACASKNDNKSSCCH